MTRACHLPIDMATGGVFSEEEKAGIIERLLAKRERIRGERPTASDREALSAAMDELAGEEVKAALIDRRLEVFAKLAKKNRETILASLPGDAGDKLRAVNVGTGKQAMYGELSVDAEGMARGTKLMGIVEEGLKAEPGLSGRMSNFFGLGENGFDRMVAREMARLNGAAVEPTGDRGAEIAARVFNKAVAEARKMQNDAGAWIAELPGYVTRQQHDRLKVSGGFWRELAAKGPAALTDWGAAADAAKVKAFRTWHDFIRDRLDDATFDGIDPSDVHLIEDAAQLHAAGVLRDPKDLRERFLYHAWYNIVTGAHDRFAGASDLGEFRPPPGKARAVSKSRVLHFKGPDAWMDYHERFGSGSLYSAVLGGLERAGRNSALMARWGPSPEAAFENTVAQLGEAARAGADVKGGRKLASSMRRAEFDEITGAGNVPDNLRLALVMRTARLDMALSKLGGMVLSGFSDAPLAAQAHARAGGEFLEGYQGAFSGITRMQGADARRAADLLDVGARSGAAHLAGRFTTSDGPLGWGASMSRLFYKVNLFEFWSDGLRRGMAEMLAAHMGEQASLPHAGVHVGWRETMERFGLDAGAWEMLRKGAVKADDGRTYLTFEALEDIADADLHRWKGLKGKQATKAAADRARSDLEWRFRTLVQTHLDDALTEARAREKVGLTRGLKAGTPWGEAARSFTQFWSFNQALIGRHLAPAARGYAGKTPALLLAHLIVATTLMGYASMQAKQIAKGRSPRPIFDEDGNISLIEFNDDEDNPGWKAGRTLNTFMASALQGGGLGIYGDFLFGEVSRGGGSPIATLGGPLVGETEKLFQITKAAMSGDVDDLPADLVKFGVSNTPFLNLFYARAALDYGIMYRLQEATSPGYLERYEKRVREREGSEFFLPPSEVIQ